MHRSGQGSGEDVAVALIKAVLIGTGILLFIALAAVASLATQFFRIYTTTAVAGTRTALVLWLVLGAFLTVLIAGVLLAVTVPSTTTSVLLTCGGSFLVFLVVVGTCDWHARQQGLSLPHDWGDLDRYLHF